MTNGIRTLAACLLTVAMIPGVARSGHVKLFGNIGSLLAVTDSGEVYTSPVSEPPNWTLIGSVPGVPFDLQTTTTAAGVYSRIGREVWLTGISTSTVFPPEKLPFPLCSDSPVLHMSFSEDLGQPTQAWFVHEDGTLWFAYSIFGGGCRAYNPPEEPTAVGDDPRAPGTVLARAWPNPFREGSTISFTLERAEAVQLDVIDLAGRRLRSLVDGPRGPGAHFVQWDGRDAAGRMAPPGVYAFRIVTPDRAATRGIVRLR